MLKFNDNFKVVNYFYKSYIIENSFILNKIPVVFGKNQERTQTNVYFDTGANNRPYVIVAKTIYDRLKVKDVTIKFNQREFNFEIGVDENVISSEQ